MKSNLGAWEHRKVKDMYKYNNEVLCEYIHEAVVSELSAISAVAHFIKYKQYNVKCDIEEILCNCNEDLSEVSITKFVKVLIKHIVRTFNENKHKYEEAYKSASVMLGEDSNSWSRQRVECMLQYMNEEEAAEDISVLENAIMLIDGISLFTEHGFIQFSEEEEKELLS